MDVQKDTKKLKVLEREILSSDKNVNGILEIMNMILESSTTTTTRLNATNALRRIFASHARKGNLHTPSSKKEKKKIAARDRLRVWMRDQFSVYLKCLVEMLGVKGEDDVSRTTRLASLRTMMYFAKHANLLQNRENISRYHFGNDMYIRIVRFLVKNKNADEELWETLIEEFLPFHDVQLYTLRNLKRILDVVKKKRTTSSSSEETNQVLNNVFRLLLEIRVPTKQNRLDNFFVEFSTEEQLVEKIQGKKRKRDNTTTTNSAHKLSSYRRAVETCWLTLLRIENLPEAMYKRALLLLPKHVIPYMEHPVLLCDFLTDSCNAGGVTSLLALEGLFILMQRHSLEYPQFYEKLYVMLTPSVFLVTYRERIYRLMHLCLLSSHLPAYLVAAFLKRLARLSLTAPPTGALYVIPLIYNMLKRHPQCEPLIQRGRVGAVMSSSSSSSSSSKESDPYLFHEANPKNSHALESSLWELRALQNHYCPAVASLAAAFDEQEKDKFKMEDFVNASYSALFTQSVKRGMRKKKSPAMAYSFVDPFAEMVSVDDS